MDCCFCFSGKVMKNDTFVFLAKERNLILLFFFYNVDICNMIVVFVIKECNHDTNAMPFLLFREQRPQNIFCQGLFGIDWCFCISI